MSCRNLSLTGANCEQSQTAIKAAAPWDKHVYIVAEIGVNHQGDPSLARRLIKIAKECGADAVKFQKRDIESLYVGDYLTNTDKHEKHYQYLIPILKKVELSKSFYHEARKLCDELNIDFIVTPFDLKSLEFVSSLNVDAIKIASWDLTNFQILDRACELGIPLILSTGAASEEEIEFATGILNGKRIEYALLHCKSVYPVDLGDINLNYMTKLRSYCPVVGYSGHETSPEIAVAATALGARVIEKHLTLDRMMDGPDHKASMLPEEFTAMVRAIRNVELGLGREVKTISQGELLNKEALSKSIVCAVDIQEGEVITRDKVTLKSPMKGLPPHKLGSILGRAVSRSLKKDDFITEGCFETRRTGGRIKFFDFAKYGLVGRFNDHPKIAPLKPKAIEYHLCNKDLNDGKMLYKCDAELIFHAPEIVDDKLVDPSSPDEETRQYALGVLRNVIIKANEKRNLFAGRPLVIIHPCAGSPTPAEDPTPYKRAFYTSFAELRTLAVSLDIELLAENLPPYPWYFGGRWYTNYFMSADDVKEFATDFGARVCLDLSHAKLYCNSTGQDFYEYISTVKPHVRHIHVSDAKGTNGEGVQIGEGDIDFVKFFSEYSDYKHTWVPEIWRGHLNDYEGFRIALDKLAVEFRKSSPHS